jgi:hypothetical protein
MRSMRSKVQEVQSLKEQDILAYEMNLLELTVCGFAKKRISKH